ncbi:MAG: Flp pilus assembly protein CpaB [Gemmataceae bacterium]
MKPKTIVLMAIAIACGLGASYMTSQILDNRDKGGKKEQIEKVTIIVAKKKLSLGMRFIEPEKFLKEDQVPKEFAPAKALRSFKEVKNLYLKESVRAGRPLTHEDVSEEVTTLPIPDGYDAVGMQVNKETTASGFATLPGNRIDIIMTISGRGKKAYSRYLLQDVLVLAADTKLKPGNGQIAMPASIVTVALKPRDILKVKTARTGGTLSLVPRGSSSVDKLMIPPLTFDQLFEPNEGDQTAALPTEKLPEPKIEKEPEQQPVQEPTPVPEPVVPEPKLDTHTVQLIQGGLAQQRIFWIDQEGNKIREVNKEEQEELQTQQMPLPRVTQKAAPRRPELPNSGTNNPRANSGSQPELPGPNNPGIGIAPRQTEQPGD